MSGKLRWLLIGVLLIVLAAPAWPQAAAPAPPVKIYLFWAEGCPHCLKEKAFLQELVRRDPAVQVIALEITASRENLELLRRAEAALGVKVSGVPFTVVGRRYLTGWLDGATSGRVLEEALSQAKQQGAPDVVIPLMTAQAPPRLPDATGKPLPEILHLPFLGDVNPKYLSLGLLTLVIGLLDGFNPCAMWVLVFLVNLLLGMEDRKKMWILGGAFILSSGAVYFLFMTAWLNLLVFLGFIPWVRVVIGLVALAAGGYNLREYWSNRAGACKLTGTARRQKRLDRIKEFVHSRKFWLALGGIILLAFAVNLVEVICSAGFPVVYIQVLSLTPMPFWQYYLYLLGYIFFYMLDDLIIFVVAMATLQLLGVGERYKRASNLVGGALMVGIGAMLILRPGWLMFG